MYNSKQLRWARNVVKRLEDREKHFGPLSPVEAERLKRARAILLATALTKS